MLERKNIKMTDPIQTGSMQIILDLSDARMLSNLSAVNKKYHVTTIKYFDNILLRNDVRAQSMLSFGIVMTPEETKAHIQSSRVWEREMDLFNKMAFGGMGLYGLFMTLTGSPFIGIPAMIATPGLVYLKYKFYIADELSQNIVANSKQYDEKAKKQKTFLVKRERLVGFYAKNDKLGLFNPKRKDATFNTDESISDSEVYVKRLFKRKNM